MKFNAKYTVFALALLVSAPAFGMQRIKNFFATDKDKQAKLKLTQDALDALGVKEPAQALDYKHVVKADAADIKKAADEALKINNLKVKQNAPFKPSLTNKEKTELADAAKTMAVRELISVQQDVRKTLAGKNPTALAIFSAKAINETATAELKNRSFLAKLRSAAFLREVMWNERTKTQRGLMYIAAPAAVAVLATVAGLVAYKFFAKNELQKNEAALENLDAEVNAIVEARVAGQTVVSTAVEAAAKNAVEALTLLDKKADKLVILAIALDAATTDKEKQAKLTELVNCIKACTKQVQEAAAKKAKENPEVSFFANIKNKVTNFFAGEENTELAKRA